MLEIGEIAPDFEADSTMGPVHLYKYAGKKNVILIFYPINNTGGCRKQLCEARDALGDYAELDAVVMGINPGKFSGHQKFEKKNNFQFPLVYDENWKIAYEFKILTFLNVMQARTVYILDKGMTVRYINKGMPTTEELVEALQAINATPWDADLSTT